MMLWLLDRLFKVAMSSPSHPHVIAILADDYGWADANWHRMADAKQPLLIPMADELI